MSRLVAQIQGEDVAKYRARQLESAGFRVEFTHAYGGRSFPLAIHGDEKEQQVALQFLAELVEAEQEIIARYAAREK